MKSNFRIICISILLVVAHLSCNKVIDSTPVSPVHAYPNPFIDMVHLYVGDLQGAQANLRVLNGKDKVFASFSEVQSGASFIVNLEAEPSGVYYIEATINGKTLLEPIIKTKR